MSTLQKLQVESFYVYGENEDVYPIEGPRLTTLEAAIALRDKVAGEPENELETFTICAVLDA